MYDNIIWTSEKSIRIMKMVFWFVINFILIPAGVISFILLAISNIAQS